MSNLSRLSNILGKSQEVDEDSTYKRNKNSINIKKKPENDFYSGIMSENNEEEQSCICACHCEEGSTQRFIHDISCPEINRENIFQFAPPKRVKYDHHQIRNKSVINIMNKENKKFCDQLRKKYDLNENKENKTYYLKYSNNNIYKYKTKVEEEKESDFGLHLYKDRIKKNKEFLNKSCINLNNMYINMNNNNKNNNEISFDMNNIVRPKNTFNLNRKESSKYYHEVNPKKYPYGEGKLQTVCISDNHRYKEIIGTSPKKNKKIMPPNKEINFNAYNNNRSSYIPDNDNNNILIEINEENSYKNKNILKPNKYKNYRYESAPNFPLDLSGSMSLKNKNNDAKIVKETYNTRLVDLKSIKDKERVTSPQKDIINNLNEEIKISKRNTYNNKINIPPLDMNKEPEKDDMNTFILNNNNTTSYNNYNLNILKKKSFLNNKSDSIDFNVLDNNKYKMNKYELDSKKKKNIPKSNSLDNLDKIIAPKTNRHTYVINSFQNDEYYNYIKEHNKTSIKKSNSMKKVDLLFLKQKEKLALLRKQMKDQEKRKKIDEENEILNLNYIRSKKYLERFVKRGEKKDMSNIYNSGKPDNLFDKTKKLLELRKLKNAKKNDVNSLNFQNKDNKLLNCLKNNLMYKNYNGYINNNSDKNNIKSKFKNWKP